MGYYTVGKIIKIKRKKPFVQQYQDITVQFIDEKKVEKQLSLELTFYGIYEEGDTINISYFQNRVYAIIPLEEMKDWILILSGFGTTVYWFFNNGDYFYKAKIFFTGIFRFLEFFF